jgi:hypothetical protein
MVAARSMGRRRRTPVGLSETGQMSPPHRRQSRGASPYPSASSRGVVPPPSVLLLSDLDSAPSISAGLRCATLAIDGAASASAWTAGLTCRLPVGAALNSAHERGTAKGARVASAHGITSLTGDTCTARSSRRCRRRRAGQPCHPVSARPSLRKWRPSIHPQGVPKGPADQHGRSIGSPRSSAPAPGPRPARQSAVALRRETAACRSAPTPTAAG